MLFSGGSKKPNMLAFIVNSCLGVVFFLFDKYLFRFFRQEMKTKKKKNAPTNQINWLQGRRKQTLNQPFYYILILLIENDIIMQ